ncbi:signal peptidase I [Pseudocolwellia sp. HL-MZ19]|uniref:signal peptidase I n=1 Tax=unclassified Pseudocolwellia TaxID=2848178 RepID=UPI003CF042E1
MKVSTKEKIRRFIKNYAGVLSFFILMVFFRSAVADWYTVPTGSMQPTIEIGDRIVVNKMAYDLKIPLTNISLKKMGEPSRGDIIVFESEAAENRLIKRVVGLPGDNISMHNEILTINGERLSYESISSANTKNQAIENLSGLKHIVKYDQTKSTRLASFNNVTVPADHYLVLGDNRRNSADSRVYGFVPRSEVKGKAGSVAFSLDYDNYYLPKPDRFLEDLYTL